tara:strand:+ start:238 stop:1218 length:981 start_codon:yes stop_codon:yes gene_type:complete
MDKSILVFSNGEKIGDGLIKLPLLYEIKRRLPEHKVYWMTNKMNTVYNDQLQNIASQYIDKIIQKADLNPFFWQKISNNYDLQKYNFDYIFDTQKAVIRTIALKRIKCSTFISASASYLFSDRRLKINKKTKRKYYLEDLFELLDLIIEDNVDYDFKIPIPNKLEKNLSKIFNNNEYYIGIAPGAGEKNKIWPLKNFIKVASYFQKKNYKLVFFLGPQEKLIKETLMEIFPKAVLPEDEIKEFSGPEIVMASTKFLSCALANDSGVSHMLSTNLCPIIKLFGPKDSEKFTPLSNKIHTIRAKDFGSYNIEKIKPELVINKMENLIS